MRIGIVTHNYPANSKERKDAGIFLYDFAHELAKKDEVFILAPEFVGKKEKYKTVTVTWFKWFGGGTKLGNFNPLSPRSIVQFFSLLWFGTIATHKFAREKKIDVLIGAWAFPAGFFCFLATRKLKIPYMTWSLGSDINNYSRLPFFKQAITISLKYANKRFANSYSLCQKVEKLSKKKCVFLPAITNLKPIKKRIKRKSSKRTFLYIGRLEKVKGVDILIEAAKNLPNNNKWEIRVGGDGELKNKLFQTAKVYNLLSNITFLGRIDANQLTEEMMSSDYLVIPSRSESLPLVIIEASRAKLPVIAADVGDCRRVIEKYKIGKVFQKENVKLLSKILNKVIDKKNYIKVNSKGFEKLSLDYNQSAAQKIFLSNVKN